MVHENRQLQFKRHPHIVSRFRDNRDNRDTEGRSAGGRTNFDFMSCTATVMQSKIMKRVPRHKL